MKKLLLLFLFLCSNPLQAECVILLHGLARTASSMEKLAEHLSEEQYLVVNLGYPSRDYSIQELAELAIQPAIKQCAHASKINFVTHSLGGILVRQYLSQHEIENLHRVVMLGPPNQGSEVVDKLSGVPGFYLINGDAGMQLGTAKDSVPNSLGRADFEVGVIAGTRSINLILSALIPGSDDGKVAVKRTQVEGMKDHIEMPVTHPFMMKNKKVIQQVMHFLQKGQFAKKSNS